MPAKLITEAQAQAMMANYRWNKQPTLIDTPTDFRPVVKLFTPWAQCTWLLTEIDPDEPSQAFGLADLGMGFPELGYVSLDELAQGRGRAIVERDRHWTGHHTLSSYAELARAKGRIVA